MTELERKLWEQAIEQAKVIIPSYKDLSKEDRIEWLSDG